MSSNATRDIYYDSILTGEDLDRLLPLIGTAGESAEAAAQSAKEAKASEGAAQTAQTAAETAREGAEMAESAAESARDEAAGSMRAAAAKADEAAGSAQAAQTAKAGAESAANAAQTARTGAESARDAAASSASTADQRATAAASSAEAAATSATAAAGSAQAAQTARAGAESAASAASTKAGEAASSAQAAASSAQAAAGSATTATQKATAAASSATAAASSASTASTKAGEAASSAQAAKASADKAAEIVGGPIPISKGGTGATTAQAARGNLGVLGSALANGYQGMTTPAGGVGTGDWIRTTQAGIIPHASDATNGKSALGTSSWPFKDIYGKALHGALDGNAATATKLKTARTLTVGGTGKNFDGTANVSFSLAEIGAAPRSLRADCRVNFTVAGDANTYYPVLIQSGHPKFAWAALHISRSYNETAPSTWNNATHKGGLTLSLRWTGDSIWGGNDHWIVVENFAESYCKMVGGLQLSTDGLVVWLRGGTASYTLETDYGTAASAAVKLSGFTAANGTTYSPRSYNAATVDAEVKAKWLVQNGRFNGAANSATDQTARDAAAAAQTTANAAMPKSGGTFTGSVYAQGGNKAGNRIMNMGVWSSGWGDVWTDRLIFIRK